MACGEQRTVITKDPKRSCKIQLFDFGDTFNYGDVLEPGLAQAKYMEEIEKDIWQCVLVFTCPGCGRFGQIMVGISVKPISGPSWLLQTGNRLDASTWSLMPSIHCVGCCGWHGYLKDGEFKSC